MTDVDAPPAPAVRRRPALPAAIAVAVALMAGAAALHVISLFPPSSVGVGPGADEAQTVILQAVLAGGWLLAAGLTAVGRTRPGGAVFATGLAAAEVGMVVADFGQVIRTSAPRAGLLLTGLAWLAGAVAAVLAVLAVRPGAGRPRLRGAPPGLLGPVTAVTAIVLGVALLPAWDRYLLDLRAVGVTRTVTFGAVFAKGTPWGAIAGNVLVAAVLALVPILAVLWRPGRLGALLTGGVLVVVLANVCSAVGSFEQTAAQLYGPAAVRTYGLTVLDSSLTAWFDVELLAGLALAILLVARWWTPDRDAPPATGWWQDAGAPPSWTGPGPWGRAEGSDWPEAPGPWHPGAVPGPAEPGGWQPGAPHTDPGAGWGGRPEHPDAGWDPGWRKQGPGDEPQGWDRPAGPQPAGPRPAGPRRPAEEPGAGGTGWGAPPDAGGEDPPDHTGGRSGEA